MERWKGKTALVTGASSGIGAAVAKALAAAGLKTAVCARRRDRLEQLCNEAGGNVTAYECDLRETEDITGMFADIRANWGGVDVLVNNAGLGHNQPLMSGDVEAWREMLDVNVLALLLCTREAVTDMRKRGDDGHIIHISSMSAHRVAPGSGVYAATKHAVRALTEAMRIELREAESNIRVTSISPGFVVTEFAQKYHQSEEAAEKTYGRYDCLTPEDIADNVLYVLSQPPHVQVHDLLVRPTQQVS